MCATAASADPLIDAAQPPEVDHPLRRTPVPPVAETDAPSDVSVPAEEPTKSDVTWDGKLEFGFSGAQGNTDRIQFRTGLNATRKRAKAEKLDISARFFLVEDRGDRTQNRLDFDARNDWYVPDSSWSFFMRTSIDLDEFKEWDARVLLGGGLAWRFIDEEDTNVTLSIGGAGTREFGGPNDDIRPDALISVNGTHEISDRQTLVGSVDYIPSLEDTSVYRITGKAAWRILLDPESKLKLELGLENRYDSDATPSREYNDLFYYVSLVVPF